VPQKLARDIYRAFGMESPSRVFKNEASVTPSYSNPPKIFKKEEYIFPEPKDVNSVSSDTNDSADEGKKQRGRKKGTKLGPYNKDGSVRQKPGRKPQSKNPGEKASETLSSNDDQRLICDDKILRKVNEKIEMNSIEIRKVSQNQNDQTESKNNAGTSTSASENVENKTACSTRNKAEEVDCSTTADNKDAQQVVKEDMAEVKCATSSTNNDNEHTDTDDTHSEIECIDQANKSCEDSLTTATCEEIVSSCSTKTDEADKDSSCLDLHSKNESLTTCGDDEDKLPTNSVKKNENSSSTVEKQQAKHDISEREISDISLNGHDNSSDCSTIHRNSGTSADHGNKRNDPSTTTTTIENDGVSEDSKRTENKKRRGVKPGTKRGKYNKYRDWREDEERFVNVLAEMYGIAKHLGMLN